jgi:hypothetical protein
MVVVFRNVSPNAKHPGCSIVSVRFKMSEIDALASAQKP